MTSNTRRNEDAPTGIPASPMHVDEEDKKNDSKTTIMPSSPPFHRDQRVWAQDPVTTRYYHASVRDLKWESSQWKFRIHYQGWNSRWDRWLDATHIANESQKEALRAAGLLSTSDGKSNDTENEESLVNSNNRKRKTDTEKGTPNRRRRTARNRKLLPFSDHCELPFTLQTVLIEEWERLTRPTQQIGKPPPRQVHVLPASVTIHQVLKHFAKKQKQEVAASSAAETTNTENPTKTTSDVTAFCNGLNQLFQASLPKCLLYNEERPQYEALLRDPVLSQKPLTEVYGCEYLLRLYVRLPFLLPTVDESTSSSVVGPLLSELLTLMQKNRQACFKGDYRRPERAEWLDKEVKLYQTAAVEGGSRMEEEEDNVTSTTTAALTKRAS